MKNLLTKVESKLPLRPKLPKPLPEDSDPFAFTDFASKYRAVGLLADYSKAKGVSAFTGRMICIEPFTVDGAMAWLEGKGVKNADRGVVRSIMRNPWVVDEARLRASGRN